MMRHVLRVSFLLMLFQAMAALAQSGPDFPELSGRVVDRADMLDPAAEARLTQMLAAHEEATSEQVVVVTVPDLQETPIEDYGYQLGRHWGIGQEGEDNGALLLVAEEERRVRIEVGYGLEGRLTDAAAATIINRIITPAFRQGDFAAGILNGAAAMIQVLGGEPLAVSAAGNRGAGTAVGERPSLPLASTFFLIMMAVVYFIGGGRGRRGRGRGGAAFLGGALLGAGMGRGGGGGFGGGGFGGGGGGFGGGGASGGW